MSDQDGTAVLLAGMATEPDPKCEQLLTKLRALLVEARSQGLPCDNIAEMVAALEAAQAP